ncbi:hypothetical protein J2S55_008677 [Streptosporangium brasiliense]|uniref:Uncharacterized protein n=1 Tax=Streptosporangium brasiliense TaxID=47480 RepID=A0ABT9RJD2_9ACTN|nr:hypothetical protein [Streptosporangium brasiliense]
MIPRLVTVRDRRRNGRRLRLNVPVVQAPILLLAMPTEIGRVPRRPGESGRRAVRGAGQPLWVLPGPGSRSSRAERPCR